MDLATLNTALVARTGQKYGLREVVEAYARAVADAADVLEVSLAGSEIRGDSGGISLWLAEQPALAVGWTPATGWYWDTAEAGRVYRVTSEADAAGLVPSPETVAAWLRVIADGDRSGHTHPPEEPAPKTRHCSTCSSATAPATHNSTKDKPSARTFVPGWSEPGAGPPSSVSRSPTAPTRHRRGLGSSSTALGAVPPARPASRRLWAKRWHPSSSRWVAKGLGVGSSGRKSGGGRSRVRATVAHSPDTPGGVALRNQGQGGRNVRDLCWS